jgi:hypothetical protein
MNGQAPSAARVLPFGVDQIAYVNIPPLGSFIFLSDAMRHFMAPARQGRG